MPFMPISIDAYIAHCQKNNPALDAGALRQKLESALNDYHDGVKCACGNDLWVIGSAHGENSCYTCLTGEGAPSDDCEIETALHKRPRRTRGRHMSEIPPHEIKGFFDDDGYELVMEAMKKPSLCLLCVNNDDPNEEVLCNLIRLNYEEGKEFICHSFRTGHIS